MVSEPTTVSKLWQTTEHSTMRANLQQKQQQEAKEMQNAVLIVSLVVFHAIALSIYSLMTGV